MPHGNTDVAFQSSSKHLLRFFTAIPFIESTVARWYIFKNPNLGEFLRALEWKMLVYYTYGH
jgi:hypothetical protein